MSQLFGLTNDCFSDWAKKSHWKEINKEQLYFVVAMQQMVHVMDLECEKW